MYYCSSDNYFECPPFLHRSKCSLDGYLWRGAAGSIFRGHLRLLECHTSRGFDWSSVSLKHIRERQKVRTTRERTDMRTEVSSRAQLQKQTAAEGPTMERTLGKLTVNQQHWLHAKRLRHSAVTIKQTHISEDRHDN